MPSVDFFERIGNLADRSPRTRGVDGERQQVAGILVRCLGECGQGLFALSLVPAAAHLLKPADLGFAHGGVVDIENVDLRLFIVSILVDADNRFLAAVDSCLAPGGRFLDAQLGHAGLDRTGHAAHLLDLVDEFAGRSRELIREALDVVGTCQRVHDLRDAGFFLQDELRVAGDAR